jgi:hypothetical protein
MSGPERAEVWSADALDRPEWAEVRALARRAIEQRRTGGGGHSGVT